MVVKILFDYDKKAWRISVLKIKKEKIIQALRLVSKVRTGRVPVLTN